MEAVFCSAMWKFVPVYAYLGKNSSAAAVYGNSGYTLTIYTAEANSVA